MTAALSSRLARLAEPLVSAPVFDFWAARLGGTLAWRRTLARVVERHVEARDTVTLVLQPNRHFRGFRPGQHVNVTVAVNGVQLTRSYSFSDAPRADGRVTITVQHVPGGRVSEQLARRTAVGDILELGEAWGDMTADAVGADRPLLLLAAGSGITPLRSLLRDRLARSGDAPVVLAYWARTRADLAFLEEFRTLATRDRRFRFQPFLTQETGLAAGELSGRVTAGALADLIPAGIAPVACACGPQGFVDSVSALAGPLAARVFAESFTPMAVPAVADAGTVQVTLARSGRTLAVDAGQPLLAALEAEGVYPPSGCRRGICHSCACTKSAGVTEDVQSGVLDREDHATVRLCVNRARTDLTLDL